MHFLITAYDGHDGEAIIRRNAVREQHLQGIKKLIAEGKALYGAAILDDDNKMIGSILMADFPSKEALMSEWLDTLPALESAITLYENMGFYSLLEKKTKNYLM